MNVRPAQLEDLPALTDIWQKGWFEAHAEHVPKELAALRTHSSFAIRLRNAIDDIAVIGSVGAPLGFCAIRDNEIHQFFVAPKARGMGAAALLMADGEARLKARGIKKAVVDVIPQNKRAIAFYEKMGWGNGHMEEIPLETLGRPFLLTCLILHKDL